jgi:hypothetical protein
MLTPSTHASGIAIGAIIVLALFIEIASRLSALRKMPCVICPDHVSDLTGHAVSLSRPSFFRRITGDASRRGTHKAAGVPLERISEALAKEVKPLGI